MGYCYPVWVQPAGPYNQKNSWPCWQDFRPSKQTRGIALFCSLVGWVAYNFHGWNSFRPLYIICFSHNHAKMCSSLIYKSFVTCIHRALCWERSNLHWTDPLKFNLTSSLSHSQEAMFPTYKRHLVQIMHRITWLTWCDLENGGRFSKEICLVRWNGGTLKMIDRKSVV